MLIPDIRDLYRLYGVLGGQSASPQPDASAANSRTPLPPYSQSPDAVSAPIGGLPGRLFGTLPEAPRWSWGSVPMPVAPVGVGAPVVTRIPGLGFVPLPVGPGSLPQIPMPHLPEPPIPQWLRGGLWAGAHLLPEALSRLLPTDARGRSAQEQRTPVSGGQPPNDSRDPKAGILGWPSQQDPRDRGSARNDAGQRSSEELDPSFRKLMRVPAPAEGAPKSDEPPSFPSDTPSYPDSLSRRTKTPQGGAPGVTSSSATKNSLRGSSGFGGNRGRGRNRPGDPDEFCLRRWLQEQDECRERYDEYAHSHHYWGCLDNASDRFKACYANGGSPPSWEPPKWRPDPHEEIWINPDR
jgi:hypothetical protein